MELTPELEGMVNALRQGVQAGANPVGALAQHPEAFQPMVDLLKVPGKAYQEGISDEEAVPWGAQTALSMMGMGAPAAEAGSAGIFGGKLARTADLDKLSKAQDMTMSRVPRGNILDETGWFRGADGKWRFEIPDTNTSVAGVKALESVGGTEGLPVPEFFRHKELYDAYPYLKKTKAMAMPLDGNSLGGYGFDPVNKNPFIVLNSKAEEFNNPNETRSVLLHELQHAIQRGPEDFAPGTGTGRVAKEAAPMALRNLGLNNVPLDHPEVRRAIENVYFRHAGEVESRNVQNRFGTAADNYMDKYLYRPWITQDTRVGKQIFPTEWQARQSPEIQNYIRLLYNSSW